MFAAMVDVLFPRACGGCDAPGSGLCSLCRPRPGVEFALDGLVVRAAGTYDSPLRTAVLRMKHGRLDVAQALGEDLATRYGSQLGAGIVLIPAPTTARRRRERGFDQARVLAAAIGEAGKNRVVDALVRRAGGPQRGRSREERLASSGRFSVDPRVAGDVDEAVLVDDVVTTGSTLREARDALLAAGIRTLFALAVARTL